MGVLRSSACPAVRFGGWSGARHAASAGARAEASMRFGRHRHGGDWGGRIAWAWAAGPSQVTDAKAPIHDPTAAKAT